MLRSLGYRSSSILKPSLSLHSRPFLYHNLKTMSTAADAGADKSGKIQEIANLAAFNELINSEKVTVIDFYATWCGPCKAIEPVLDALAERVPEVNFGRVDVDQAQDVAQEYGVTAMPTIFYFQKGEKLNYVVGANLPKIVSLVQEYSKVDISAR